MTTTTQAPALGTIDADEDREVPATIERHGVSFHPDVAVESTGTSCAVVDSSEYEPAAEVKLSEVSR